MFCTLTTTFSFLHAAGDLIDHREGEEHGHHDHYQVAFPHGLHVQRWDQERWVEFVEQLSDSGTRLYQRVGLFKRIGNFIMVTIIIIDLNVEDEDEEDVGDGDVEDEDDVPGAVSEQHYKPSKLLDGDRFSNDEASIKFKLQLATISYN